MMEDRARQVGGLMAVTMLFALINAYSTPKGNRDPFPILLGGFAATAILVGLTQLGDAGAELGVGLAYVATGTATLVYGGPVWSLLSSKVGGKPTAPLSGVTAPTGATHPSGATAPTLP